MKKGFTLMEILIAMVILGVIAILVIPNAFMNIQNKTFVTKLKTVDNTFRTVINKALIDARVTSLADTVYSTSSGDFLKQYFKTVSDCGTSYSQCLATTYQSLNGERTISTSTMLNNNFYCITIPSGTVVCSTNMTQDSGSTRGYSTVVVDLNGSKAPNKNGRDLFSFNVYTDGKIANSYDPSEDDANGKTCKDKASSAGYEGACYSKIVADNWKMTY